MPFAPVSAEGDDMQERSIIECVAIPERKVEALDLPPDRVAGLELQFMQLREEIRAEFSAVRDEVRGGDEETRRHLRILHDNLIARLSALGDSVFRRKR
jgi:hypothetical protein